MQLPEFLSKKYAGVPGWAIAGAGIAVAAVLILRKKAGSSTQPYTAVAPTDVGTPPYQYTLGGTQGGDQGVPTGGIGPFPPGDSGFTNPAPTGSGVPTGWTQDASGNWHWTNVFGQPMTSILAMQPTQALADQINQSLQYAQSGGYFTQSSINAMRAQSGLPPLPASGPWAPGVT